MSNLIEVENLSIAFSKHKVYDDFSITFPSGQICCILGASGTGKTVLIRCILGFVKYQKGKVLIDGIEPKNKEIVNKIGYMSQFDAIYEDFTARENMDFFANLYKIPNKKDKIEELLELVDLDKIESRPVLTYSGGMKKRLSFAITLLHDPKILVLDEPTVGIDPLLREKLWEHFKLLKSRGKSIILTTHVMDEAEKSDRVILLSNGKILAQGNPDELKIRHKMKTIEEIFLFHAKQQATQSDK